MTTPLPEEVPGYNTTPRLRSKKKLWFLDAPTSLEGYYSPFWPLLIVFLAFIILLVYEISFFRYRTMVLRAQNLHLVDGVKKAKEQIAFIEGVHADLDSLAPGHPAAATLLKEFFPPVPAAPPAPDDLPKTP